MWTNKQKARIKAYQRAAGMGDQEYRQMLYTHTGAMSSTHETLSQRHFDKFMPVLELRVEAAVARGAARPKWLRNLRYWRNRIPQGGEMSTRQRWKIEQLFRHLAPLIEEPVADEYRYLARMAEQACGRRVRDFWQMQAWQANLLTEALKDRLQYALRRAS